VINTDKNPAYGEALRLAGARTLAEGNTLIPAFMADYNDALCQAAGE
jgi:hypothetical protein